LRCLILAGIAAVCRAAHQRADQHQKWHEGQSAHPGLPSSISACLTILQISFGCNPE
jgi:hypothetical protein